MKDLEALIQEMESQRDRELSDEYLREIGCSTREDVGIGEYVYGIVMVPVSWVLPHLKGLLERRKKNDV